MHSLLCCPVQATHLDGKLTLPRLGLAQLNVLQNEAVNAASLLESVLVDAPQWIDALEVRWQRHRAVCHALRLLNCLCTAVWVHLLMVVGLRSATNRSQPPA